jgi:hypothetical protein
MELFNVYKKNYAFRVGESKVSVMMRLALRRKKSSVTFFPIASVEISKSNDTISLFTVAGGVSGNPTSVEPSTSPIFLF